MDPVKIIIVCAATGSPPGVPPAHVTAASHVLNVTHCHVVPHLSSYTPVVPGARRSSESPLLLVAFCSSVGSVAALSVSIGPVPGNPVIYNSVSHGKSPE